MDSEPSIHGPSAPPRGFAGNRRPGPPSGTAAVARRRSSASARVLKGVASVLLIAYFAAGLAYLGLRHLVWPHPERWLPHVEQALSEAFGRAVQIGPVTAGFDGLRPSLDIEGFSILEEDGRPVLAARRVHAALSLTSLATGRLRFAHLEIDSPVLTVERLGHRRIRVAGIVLDRDRPAGDGSGAEWLLAQRRIVLRDARLDWIDRVSGRSLTVSRADLAIGNVGRRHRASLQVGELPGVGRGLDLSIELHRPVFSRIRDWRSWDAELHLGAEQLELLSLETLIDSAPVPDELSVWMRRLSAGGGQASVRVWAGLEQGGTVDGKIKLGVSGARFDFGARPLAIDELAIEANFERDDAGIELRLARAQLQSPPDAALRTRGDSVQRIRLDSRGQFVSAGLSFERIEAAALRTIAVSLPWPDAARERIEALSLSGSIDGLSVEWLEPSRASDLALDSGRAGPLFTIEARIEGLSVSGAAESPRKGAAVLPSLTNLSGSVLVSESAGSLSLASRQLELRFPEVFAEPAIPLDSLDGAIAWRWVAEDDAPARLQVDIESLRFSAPDAAGRFSGRYRHFSGAPGEIDLTGRLDRADATRVARYLPLTLPADVRRWVAGSVTAGRSDDVRFTVRGRLEDFPFRDPSLGEFRIEAALRDVRLEYAPGFAPIERIRGRLLFERAGMDLRTESAQVWGVALGAVRAGINDLLDPRLQVQGSASGPASDLLRFVNESPIRDVAGEFARALRIEGQASLRLGLQIPLEDVDSMKIAGAVELPGNRVGLSAEIPEISEVRGRVEFSESALALRRLTGTFLGSPLRVDGEMAQAGVLRVTALGRASSQAIRRLLDHPITRALDGETEWRAEFDVSGETLSMRLQSNLVGLGSRLPAPFAKAPADAWPLRVQFRPLRPPAAGAPSPGQSIRILLRDDVGLELERRHDSRTGATTARRGVLSVGAPLVLPAEGIAVRVDAPMLDVDAWSAIVATGSPETGADATSARDPLPLEALSLPTEWSLVVDSMRFAGKQLNEVVLGGTRQEKNWQANIHSREIDGHFSWSGAAPGRPVGALEARFRRLEIPSSQIEEVASLIDSSPSTLPALDITAEEFVLKDRKLGALSVKASNAGTPQAPVWRLERLRIEHPSATLSASGDWKAPRGVLRRSTSLEIDLKLRDSGRLLGVFGLPDTMTGAAGSVKGRLGWIGSPLSIDLPTLGGDLDLSLGPGAFLRTDPGIAKLIGVVSLQSLRRRLAFDFRDLFAEGFTFDSVGGKARLASGILSTEDFSIRGITAQVVMTGTANLVDETQSLQVEVRPDINAGLASLAYAALANPAVGLGSFIAQWVLRKPLQQLFAWQYEVTGSWTEPQVVTRSRPQIDATPSGG